MNSSCMLCKCRDNLLTNEEIVPVEVKKGGEMKKDVKRADLTDGAQGFLFCCDVGPIPEDPQNPVPANQQNPVPAQKTVPAVFFHYLSLFAYLLR